MLAVNALKFKVVDKTMHACLKRFELLLLIILKIDCLHSYIVLIKDVSVEKL